VHFPTSGDSQVKSSALSAWSKRAEASRGGLPNLGLGGALVAVFVSSYFAARIGNALLVIVFYGPNAFFARGVRVSDWKHGIASNGAIVPFTGPVAFAGTLLLTAFAEIVAGFLLSFLRTRPRWLSAVAGILGGSMLLTFSGWLLLCERSPLIHPIPLSGLIGGAMMINRAVRYLLIIPRTA